MKVTGKHFYAFDMATFVRAFTEQEVVQAKFADAGAKDVEISLNQTDNGFEVNISRAIPAEVPSALKAFVGEWNQVTQTEVWSGSNEAGYRCEMKVDIDGVPVNIAGVMEVTSSGILTTNNIEFDVTCGIPLLGGQLAKFVASNIEKSMEQEFRFIKAYLG